MINRAKTGDHVRVQYLGLLPDGTASPGHHGRQVLAFTVGGNDVIPGISLGVVGMARGEQRRLTLQPEHAYGAIRPKLIQEIPRQRFPTHMVLWLGKWIVSVGVISGRRRRVQIVEVKPETIVVDGNHPLAGKILEVEVQLVSLDPSSTDNGEARYDLGGEA